jgi:hypothetical protein
MRVSSCAHARALLLSPLPFALLGTPAVRAPCGHIPHGVPPAPRCGGAALRAALGLAPDAFLFLTGGLLSPAKGVHSVLAAFPRVLSVAPSAVLLIAGAPHPSDARGAAYAAQLRAAAASSPAARAVAFLPGYASSDDVQRLYAAAHVFIAAHTSRGQRSSGTLAAALAAGAAGIATPFPAAVELLGGGRGRVVPFGDEGALSDAMAHMAAAPHATAAMGAASAARAARHAWPRVGARYTAAAAAAAAAARNGNGSSVALREGGAAWLRGGVRAVAAPQLASLRNGVLRVSCARNEGWVDGTGPGWAPLDTWVARARAGWGEDAALLKGTFLAHDVPIHAAEQQQPQAAWWWTRAVRALRRARRARRTHRTVSVRLFEGAATRCALLRDGDAHAHARGAAPGTRALRQSWAGPLRAAPPGGVAVAARRTLSLSPRAQHATLDLSVALTGAGVPALRNVRLAAAVDQLSATAPPEHFTWTFMHTQQHNRNDSDDAPNARVTPFPGQPGALLRLPPAAALLLRGVDARGCAAQLRVTPLTRGSADDDDDDSRDVHRHADAGGEEDDGEAWTLPPPHAAAFAELRLDGTGAPHALTHVFDARSARRAADDVGDDAPHAPQRLLLRARFELRWTAEQPPDAPPLCAPPPLPAEER